MAKSTRKSSPTATHKTVDPASWIERLERTSLCGAVALLVATPLIPSEAVAQEGTGAVLVMLWFLLLPTWLLCRLASTQRWLRLDATIAAVLVFLAVHTVSGLACLSSGNGRYALNVVWQWLSFGAAFFLVRQMVISPRRVRALLAVMLGLAVTLSSHGVYQYFVVMPQNRADYKRDPEETLRKIGVVAPPGSLERRQIEDRLFSVEPTSTFALTNSLASFLSPLLVLLAGIAVANPTRLRTDRGMLAAVLGVCLIVGACLLLTKSRTAFLATAAGMVLLPVLRGTRMRLAGWQLLAVGGLLLAGLLGGVIATGGLDLKVLSEAPKSVLYRLEYWQATMHMIADQPLLGCGPGNFQMGYTAHKLPQASETVAEPHNFLLEVWATAGTLGLLAFLAIAAAAILQLRAGDDEVQVASQDAAGPSGGAPARSSRDLEEAPVYLGAVLGVLLAFPCGWLVGFPVESIVLPLALTVGLGTVGLLQGWVRQGDLPTWTIAAAMGVLLLNLLAAGGVGFPGVAQTGWVLLACLLNLRGRVVRWSPPRAATVAIGAAALALPVLCFLTLYRPVLQCQAELNQGNAYRLQGQFRDAEAAYTAAAASDPFSSVPWLSRAQLYHDLLRNGGGDAERRSFREATDQAQGRDPRSSSLMTRIGHWYLTLQPPAAQALTPAQEDAQDAAVAYQRASDLYPHGNMERAQLAWAHYLAGDLRRAGQEAAEALRLDGLVPHQERKLSQRILVGDTGQVIEGHAKNSPPSPKDGWSAEQRMHQLRTLSEAGNS